MWKCLKCNEYRFATECHCEEFLIINKDGEKHKVRAMDEEGAALKYAEESNEDRDYYLMDASVVITVNGKKFAISAEPDVHYSASEIKEQPNNRAEGK
jgi:hypothetical protein